jgi:general stress protein YciG
MAISDRGFASMDENKKREIQSMGGKASGGGNKTTGTNRSTSTGRGSNLTSADRSKGGKSSQK